MITLLAQETSTTLPIWVLILTGLISSGLFTAALGYWTNRNKNAADTEKVDAEAADIIQRAAGDLIERIRLQSVESDKRNAEQRDILIQQNKELSLQLAELQAEVAKIPELQASIAELQHGVHLLTQQLHDAGIRPIYPPVPPSI